VSVTVHTVDRNQANRFPLARLGAVGGIRFTHGADGGCLEASAELDVPPSFSHSSLTAGRLFEVFDGPVRVWIGKLAPPDRGRPWRLVAAGLAGLGARFASLDSSNLPTTTLSLAVPAAITRGLPWQPPAAYPAATLTQDAPRDLGALLAATCAAQTPPRRWGVNRDALLSLVADPTAPTYRVIGSDNIGGRAIGDYYSTIIGRYYDQTATTTAARPVIKAVIAGGSSGPLATTYGANEYVLDLTALGIIPSATAQSIVNGLLTLTAPMPIVSGALTVHPGQVHTLDGVPARLTTLTGGALYRFIGVQPDPLGGALRFDLGVDVLIGEVEYDNDSQSAVLTPVNVERPDLGSIVADYTTRIARRFGVDLAAA
jgi:hypothetical protein